MSSSEIQGDDQSGCVTVSSFVRPPERREVPAEVQFEVAPNTVSDITNLRTARLRTGQGQQWKEQVDARLKLGSCRRPEPIDLGLRRAQRFTVERGQTPDKSIDKRVEVAIVQRAVHPAIALGDISVEVVAAKHDLKCPRAADQTRKPLQSSAARDESDADLGVAEQRVFLWFSTLHYSLDSTAQGIRSPVG